MGLLRTREIGLDHQEPEQINAPPEASNRPRTDNQREGKLGVMEV